MRQMLWPLGFERWKEAKQRGKRRGGRLQKLQTPPSPETSLWTGERQSPERSASALMTHNHNFCHFSLEEPGHGDPKSHIIHGPQRSRGSRARAGTHTECPGEQLACGVGLAHIWPVVSCRDEHAWLVWSQAEDIQTRQTLLLFVDGDGNPLKISLLSLNVPITPKLPVNQSPKVTLSQPSSAIPCSESIKYCHQANSIQSAS